MSEEETKKDGEIQEQMNSEDTIDSTSLLIDDLVQKSRPVKPVKCPNTRSFLWIFMVIIFITIGVSFHGARHDFDEAIMNPLFLMQAGAMLISGIIATIATFDLSIPREKIRTRTCVFLGLSSSVVLASQIHCFVMSGGISGLVDYFFHMIGFQVLLKGLSFIAIPAIALFWVIRKSAPTHLPWAAGAALLAIASFFSLSCKFICPINEPGYLFMWQYVPIVIFVCLGVALGRRLLRW